MSGKALKRFVITHGVMVAVITASACGGPREPSPPDATQPEAAPIRVLVPPEPIAFLPRDAHPVATEEEILEGFAEALDRPLQLIPERRLPQMIERLLAGEADLIAASLTVTEDRHQQLLFSEPYLYTDELLVASSDRQPVQDLARLADWKVCLRPSSSYADTVRILATQGIAIPTHDLDSAVSTIEALELVADGACDATGVDRYLWNAVAGGFSALHPVAVLAEDRAIAIAGNPNAKELIQLLNQHLVERSLVGDHREVLLDDLPGLAERGRLRMITRNNALTYYLYRGQQMGFEFEMMGKLADSLDLNLEVAVPSGHDELETWLLEGRGDVIASAWTITEERSDRVEFTRPYQTVDQVVVTRGSETAVKAPRDLNGRTVHVRASSAYAESLRALQDSVPNIALEWVAEDIETEEILARVEDGTYDITVCDSNLLNMEQTYGRNLRAAFTLATTRLGWAVRPDNPKLLQALNGFIAREYRGLHYNIWRKRYFQSQKQIARARDELRADASGKLSPYDDLIREHAEAHTLDWRLVAAIIYQESRFDPDETSWAGAIGLMQMMPRTGRAMGAKNLRDPSQAIAAGCRYLRSLIDSFEPALSLATRIRFALASYNAGRGHLMDARWLARRQGFDGDVWYDSVERAMLLLEREAYHSQTRYGYCRGSEPVAYVRNVERWYRVYSQHLPRITPVGE